MEERKKVADFELRDHGIDHAQYFPGYSTVFTRFDRCYTGCGDNPAEAFNDALEQIAMDDFDAEDLETRILAEENDAKPMPEKPGAHDDCHNAADCEIDDCEDCREHEGCELYYYMSILITKE